MKMLKGVGGQRDGKDLSEEWPRKGWRQRGRDERMERMEGRSWVGKEW